MLRKLLFVTALFAALFAVGIAAPSTEAAPPGDTIVDVAVEINGNTGEFSTLIAALGAADPAVLATLDGNGQFTVFAPTDAAFAAIGLDPTNIGNVDQDALTNILLYHAARGNRDAADVTSSTQIRMLNGQFTDIGFSASGQPMIDDANIVATDVYAANGVIHVIDAVLIP